MKQQIAYLAMFFGIFGLLAGAAAEISLYSFTLDDIDGKPVDLKTFEGKVVLVINTASKCGLTPQYEGLQALFEKYRDRGFVVLGFPANNFRGQEPGTNEEIKEFCLENYGVAFPMFAKISVKGDDIHPLYQYLTSGAGRAEFSGEITWNFEKFLFDRRGRVAARFKPRTAPESEEVVQAVENLLKIE